MINEDFERDFLTDAIYLQEEVHELKMQIMEEINRNAAIIKVIKDESKNNISEVSRTDAARIYVGYDLPAEVDRTGSGYAVHLSRQSQNEPTLSNNP
jgi:hypothetical protein